MGTFVNSISNIVNLPATFPKNRQSALINHAIKNSIIDTVNFSSQSKNLFDIGQIDTQFDGIFGLPNELTDTQTNQLKTLQKGLDSLFTNTNANFQTLDFDKTYNNLVDNFLPTQNISDTQKKQLQSMATELKNLMGELSISQLSGTQQNSFSSFSQGYNTLFDPKLTEDEAKKMSTLSLQLNRLFFTSEDSQTSSFLDTFNSLYGLNSPDQEQLNQAFNLFAQRNTLLSSVLADRNFNTTYASLL